MPKPDFIGIGAAKSGTTWLADVLREHTGIFIPKIKEIQYFNPQFPYMPDVPNRNLEKGLTWYNSFFDEARKDQILGEISPAYMLYPETAKAIYDYNPEVKIIAVLRKPIEHFSSLFSFFLQKGFVENIPYEELFEKRPEIIDSALFHRQLKPYFDIFPHENIKILFYDGLRERPKVFMEEVYSFLGVENYYPEIVNQKTNVTGQARYTWLNRSLERTRKFFYSKMPFALKIFRFIGISFLAEQIRDKVNTKKGNVRKQLDQQMELRLYEYYKEDIEMLEKLINTDLTSWKQNG